MLSGFPTVATMHCRFPMRLASHVSEMHLAESKARRPLRKYLQTLVRTDFCLRSSNAFASNFNFLAPLGVFATVGIQVVGIKLLAEPLMILASRTVANSNNTWTYNQDQAAQSKACNASKTPTCASMNNPLN